MIKHIVMWKFKEGNEQKISEFLKGLEGLVGQIDVIRSLKTGMNANAKEKFGAVLECEFDSLEDLNAYATDPRHVAVASTIKDIALERACVDYEF